MFEDFVCPILQKKKTNISVGQSLFYSCCRYVSNAPTTSMLRITEVASSLFLKPVSHDVVIAMASTHTYPKRYVPRQLLPKTITQEQFCKKNSPKQNDQEKNLSTIQKISPTNDRTYPWCGPHVF
jgi:hypothetical protein